MAGWAELARRHPDRLARTGSCPEATVAPDVPVSVYNVHAPRVDNSLWRCGIEDTSLADFIKGAVK
jgi:hypothetical protein